MTSNLRIILIHLTMFLDVLGNWMFNIYLFNQLNGLDEKITYIAVLFTCIRLSNFFSLFAGGKFLNSPKTYFLITIMIRIGVLIFAFYLLDPVNQMENIRIVLIVIFIKNIFSGNDKAIYTQMINEYIDNREFHYKIREYICSLSLIVCYPAFQFSIQINYKSPILFDIISFIFLFALVLRSDFILQLMQKTFFIKLKDLKLALASVHESKEILFHSFVLILSHTIVFNYSYEYFLSLKNVGDVSFLYTLIGLSFLIGNILSKYIKFLIDYRFVVLMNFIIYYFSINSNQSSMIIVLLFFVANIAMSFNSYKLNVKYFSILPKEHSVVLTNINTFILLSASIFGAWLLVLLRTF